MGANLKKMLIGVWVTAAVILLLGGVAVFHQYRDVNEREHWLSHTRDVLNNLEKILSQNWRAESYMRAYKLTNDAHFLATRNDALHEMRSRLKELQALTEDNKVQQDSLQRLSTIIDERAAVGDSYLAMQKRGLLTRERTAQTVETGNRVSIKLQNQIAVAQKEEQRLLAIRQAQFASDDRLAKLYLTIAGLFVLGCMLSAIAVTITYLSEKSRMETRFRAIFDQTFQFLGMLSASGSILDVNKTTLNFIGTEMRSLVGVPFWEGPWWGDSAEAKQRAHNAVTEASSGIFVRWETEYVDRHSKSITVDVSLKPVMDDDGKLVFLLAEARDITERVRAESEVRSSEQKLQSVLSSVAEGIYQIDVNGDVVFMNKAAQKMTLLDEKDALGKSMHELIHSSYPDGRARPIEDCPLVRVIHTGKPQREREDWFRRSDGTYFPIEYVSSPLTNGEKITGAVVAFQDITQRQEAANRVSEFYSAVSHELRTPLTSIRGALRLMEGGKAGELTARGKQLVKMGRQECDRLVRLINDILDIRKIEAGKLELKIEKLDIVTVIKQTLENLNSLAAESRVTLSLQGSEPLTIHADKDRLIQIMTNLISNAIKFSPEGGTVLVRAMRAGSSIRFEVTDNGPGISTTNQEKLFKLFQQVDSSDARPKGGTGLGLAISLALVQMHNGTIGVESAEGKGSTFWFQLPVTHRSEPLHLHDAETEAKRKNRPELLMVEDDDSLSSMLNLSLVDQFVVRRVETIAAAQDALLTMKPKAILLDLHLPDGNGLEFVERLRQSAETQDIPVVVMSGSEPSVGKFSQPVVIDYLRKPFREADLLQSLQRALKYRPKRNAHALIVEDDEATQDVLREQLKRIGVDSKVASSGEQAVELLFSEKFDLLVLDLGLPDVSGNTIVEVLKQEGRGDIPLLVYTAQDLSTAEQTKLTLGVTRHLTKSIATEEQFLAAVKDLLKDLVRHDQNDTIA